MRLLPVFGVDYAQMQTVMNLGLVCDRLAIMIRFANVGEFARLPFQSNVGFVMQIRGHG